MRTLKIVVTGAFNAGKTTLIKTLCGRILKTDMKRIYVLVLTCFLSVPSVLQAVEYRGPDGISFDLPAGWEEGFFSPLLQSDLLIC